MFKERLTPASTRAWSVNTDIHTWKKSRGALAPSLWPSACFVCLHTTAFRSQSQDESSLPFDSNSFLNAILIIFSYLNAWYSSLLSGAGGHYRTHAVPLDVNIQPMTVFIDPPATIQSLSLSDDCMRARICTSCCTVLFLVTVGGFGGLKLISPLAKRIDARGTFRIVQ